MKTLSVVTAVLAAMPALAHHSNSAFDPEKVVVLKGTVAEWRWTNPHVWIVLSVDDGNGSDLFSPHSDQLSVQERIRFSAPGVLEDRITATDPKALLEPFTQVRTYRKASPPNDELREFSCAEGLLSVK